MSDLSVFFAQNAAEGTTETIVVSPRFRDAAGEPVAWTLRSMTEEENEVCRKAATKLVKGRNGVRVPEMNSDDYMANLVAASVVYPNLKDAELQKSYGVMGAGPLVKKMLLPGEYALLIQKVQELNGFDNDMNELVDEVKN